MRIAKLAATLSAAAALAIAPAMTPSAFATNNSQNGGAVQQADLEKNGWYCMQSSEASYYYVCTKVFDRTFECHFGICTPEPIRRPTNRLTRTPSGTLTTTTTAPRTTTTTTSTATTTIRTGH